MSWHSVEVRGQLVEVGSAVWVPVIKLRSPSLVASAEPSYHLFFFF